jgi:Na+/H+ antiporter NhaD/arsenite permease-like protein
VHIGYLAAIVAASNAGGAGSVVGDTTTTMMWIAGGSPMQVIEAYVAAVPALLFFGIIAAIGSSMPTSRSCRRTRPRASRWMHRASSSSR